MICPAVHFHEGRLSFLCSSATAAHPVGTTIRVQDFLKPIPVRRQTALKTASKTLFEIRKLLRSYAFARYNIRFSFKVLKSQTDKHKWSYGLSTESKGLLAATAKIMGKELAAQYERKQWHSFEEASSDEGFHVDAIVFKADLGKSDEGSRRCANS